MVVKSLVWWMFLLLPVELVNELNLFYVSKPIMRFTSGASVLFGLLALWVNHFAKKKRDCQWVKYVLLTEVLLLTFFLLTALNLQALLVMLIPIVVASYYNDRKLVVRVITIAILLFLLSVWLSGVMHTLPVDFLKFLLVVASPEMVSPELQYILDESGGWIESPVGKLVFFYGVPNALQGAIFGIMSLLVYQTREKNHRRQIIQMQSVQDNITLSMSDIIESRDISTGGHVKRTSHVMELFVEELKKNDRVHDDFFWDAVVKTAPLHDLGKISVDDAILRKQGRLSPAEYEKIKAHPVNSGILVEKVFDGLNDPDYVNIARNISLYHHEHWDGHGYPEGLCGEEIPFEARVMAYVDVTDALMSKRSYKEAYTAEESLEIVRKNSGSIFDPSLLAAFEHVFPAIKEYYAEIGAGGVDTGRNK